MDLHKPPYIQIAKAVSQYSAAAMASFLMGLKGRSFEHEK